MSQIAASLHRLEHATGVVIPVYLPPDSDPAFARDLIGDTVHLFARQIADPAAIVLSVDGPGPATAIAQEVAAAQGAQVVVSSHNRGKFVALAAGMARLLALPQLAYFAAVDQDGDHFGNELLNFVRAADHVTAGAATDNVLVLGNRASRHRPLGFLRAEQEELANRMLLDALAYHAARMGRPLRLEYLTTTTPLPDFHSGYKLFSRVAAQSVFAGAAAASPDPDEVTRHACEAVMVVEAHLAGSVLAAVSRHTYDEQPVSLFAAYNRARLAADMIVWPCRRLGVPGRFITQWLANHIPTLLLGTLAPQGRDELAAIRDLVLSAYGLDPATVAPPLFTRPRFV
jgi:hypothetical protein